ncbi:hypothetical protein C9I56_35770 [Paraburkholderia caribensis]|nr:hypothetical protein C9I56_35770 [Paraburkholderia caribensis]
MSSQRSARDCGLWRDWKGDRRVRRRARFTAFTISYVVRPAVLPLGVPSTTSSGVGHEIRKHWRRVVHFRMQPFIPATSRSQLGGAHHASRRSACRVHRLAAFPNREAEEPHDLRATIFGLRCRAKVKTRTPYPAEFRAQMVELVKAGRTPQELAREFEPTAQTITNWVAQADRDAGCVMTG